VDHHPAAEHDRGLHRHLFPDHAGQAAGRGDQFAYSIYLCAGIITWGLFAEIVGRSQTMFIENANLLKKVSFPRLCLPVILSLNALVNFALIFGLFVIFSGRGRRVPRLGHARHDPVAGHSVAVFPGAGRLPGHPQRLLPRRWPDGDRGPLLLVLAHPHRLSCRHPARRVEAMLRYNPMYPLMSAYQDIMVYGQTPDWGSLWPVTLVGLVLCALGVRLFLRRAGEMVDEL
jgi:lipopolysaccharide transport system permease protein